MSLHFDKGSQTLGNDQVWRRKDRREIGLLEKERPSREGIRREVYTLRESARCNLAFQEEEPSRSTSGSVDGLYDRLLIISKKFT